MSETGICCSRKTRLLFSGVKNQEALRRGKDITHEEFIIFLIKLYTRVGGDTMALDAAWAKVREEIAKAG